MFLNGLYQEDKSYTQCVLEEALCCVNVCPVALDNLGLEEEPIFGRGYDSFQNLGQTSTLFANFLFLCDQIYVENHVCWFYEHVLCCCFHET